ncbi:MAG: tRNA glutamyl-Q(34) synthetase GluQRS [Candidatus Puniceispirillaceae bacterium]
MSILAFMIDASSLHFPDFGSGYLTRFAPSPTGYLHLGHAYSALMAWQAADRNPERFILRIDDLDDTRSRPEFEQALIDDLQFLGISWAEVPRRQSQFLERYRQFLQQLIDRDIVYACFLSRKQIENSLSAPHHPPQFAPSTRQAMSETERQDRLEKGEQAIWRLDAMRASELAGRLYWTDFSQNSHLVRPEEFGDVIIGRRDMPGSYHLSVVIDDADSNIELVVRGEDLLGSTPIHRLLQALLDLPSPLYYHHPLVCDIEGNRLAKRNDSLSIRKLRNNGLGQDEIISHLAHILSRNDKKVEKNT